MCERYWWRRMCCSWRWPRGLVAVDKRRGHGVAKGGRGGGGSPGKVSGRGLCRGDGSAGCVAS